MPRVYDIDDTYGISARPRLVIHFARIACQMQVMRVLSLPALLSESPLAKNRDLREECLLRPL
jgi:hypothetical protein